VELVLISLAVIVALAALVLDLNRAAYHHRQLQSGSEAAALAAAAQLFAGGPLDELEAPAAGSFQTGADADVARRIRLAGEEARLFAEQNMADGRPILLHPNPANRPNGDIVMGWVDQPTRLCPPMEVWDGYGEANSVLVRARNTEAGGNPLTLWLGRMLGVPTVDVVGSARATVDQQIYGFRPVGHVHVPLVPLLLITKEGSSLFHGEAMPAETDATQGQRVTPKASGHRGPVISLRLVLESDGELAPGPGQAVVAVPWVTRHDEPTLTARRVQRGLGPDDLVQHGGQITRGVAYRLAKPNRIAWDAWRRALSDLRGQKRIWATAHLESSPDPHEAVCRVVDFAAARLVDCTLDGNVGLRVNLEPCRMHSPTARVRPGEPRNPWIGKLVLTQ
jgi:hypothetical protein